MEILNVTAKNLLFLISIRNSTFVGNRDHHLPWYCKKSRLPHSKYIFTAQKIFNLIQHTGTLQLSTKLGGVTTMDDQLLWVIHEVAKKRHFDDVAILFVVIQCI